MEDAPFVQFAMKLLVGTEYTVIRRDQVAEEPEPVDERPWDLNQFAKWCRHSPLWVKQNILYKPWIKAKLNKESGGWVTYSSGSGSPWIIPVEQTKQFVIQNKLLE